MHATPMSVGGTERRRAPLDKAVPAGRRFGVCLVVARPAMGIGQYCQDASRATPCCCQGDESLDAHSAGSRPSKAETSRHLAATGLQY
jgi:hypothetical protein